MKINFLIITIFLFAFVSCNDESDTKTYFFSGITERNDFGDIIGNIDTTDWRFDDIFTVEELALFDDLLRNQQESPTLKAIGGDSRKISFYPNPTNTTGCLSFGNYIATSIVIVDNKFNKLVTIGDNKFQSLILDFESFNNGIYRIYYLSQDQNGEITGKGHGDIMIE